VILGWCETKLDYAAHALRRRFRFTSHAAIVGSRGRSFPRTLGRGAELIDELFTLTTGWANAHPEQFERASVEDFDDLISYVVHDEFDQVMETLKRVELDVTKVLQGDDYSGGELAFHAPPHLLELIENAAKMLHVWSLQIEAAEEAISAATAFTGHQIERPGDGSRPFFPSADD
jgi:hypothetical protein